MQQFPMNFLHVSLFCTRWILRRIRSNSSWKTSAFTRCSSICNNSWSIAIYRCVFYHEALLCTLLWLFSRRNRSESSSKTCALTRSSSICNNSLSLYTCAFLSWITPLHTYMVNFEVKLFRTIVKILRFYKKFLNLQECLMNFY